MNRLVILSIDTSTETGSVGLSIDGQTMAQRTSSDQRDHAAWVQVAIQELLNETGKDMRDVRAVAVTSGPGSYTGLRVGMATAKGICYALNVPLITENTLKVMAFGVIRQEGANAGGALFCPMIDARRMEVFAAVYDGCLQERVKPGAYVLDEAAFGELLNRETVIFFGSGSAKWKHLCSHTHARFIEMNISMVSCLGEMAAGLYSQGKFADLAYENPAYLKEFYSYTKK